MIGGTTQTATCTENAKLCSQGRGTLLTPPWHRDRPVRSPHRGASIFRQAAFLVVCTLQSARRDFHCAIESENGRPKLVVLEAGSIAEIDFTAARTLTGIIRRCRESGIAFAIARIESVRTQHALATFGVLSDLGENRLFLVWTMQHAPSRQKRGRGDRLRRRLLAESIDHKRIHVDGVQRRWEQPGKTEVNLSQARMKARCQMQRYGMTEVEQLAAFVTGARYEDIAAHTKQQLTGACLLTLRQIHGAPGVPGLSLRRRLRIVQLSCWEAPFAPSDQKVHVFDKGVQLALFFSLRSSSLANWHARDDGGTA